MPSTYSPDLRIELIANGEQSGTWGTTTNTNLGTLIEDAIAGRASVSVTSANQALTASNGSADEARCAAVDLSIGAWGSPANFSVYVPPVTKLYVVRNTDSTYTATVYCSTVLGNTTQAGTGVAVPPGKSVLLRSDGTNIIEQLNYIAGNFDVAGDAAVAGGFTVAAANNILSSAFLGSAQTATINVATPAVITVSASPPSGTAVVFSTTDTLPTGLTVGTTYYVSKINATTFNVSASSTLSPLVATSGAGAGTHTVATVSLAITPPLLSNNNQLATTAFVNQLFDQVIDTTNWAISETTATQTATITIASPAVVTVATSPANGTAVSFSTTGALPTGITANQPYYVANRTSTTYNLATDITLSTLIDTSGSQSGTQTETTSKLYFKYKSIDRLSLDLGGNLIVSGNVTAYGTV
jgi:hypothetical protein